MVNIRLSTNKPMNYWIVLLIIVTVYISVHIYIYKLWVTVDQEYSRIHNDETDVEYSRILAATVLFTMLLLHHFLTSDGVRRNVLENGRENVLICRIPFYEPLFLELVSVNCSSFNMIQDSVFNTTLLSYIISMVEAYR